eukprot:6887765-Ditylum_brightwellii.AAC.1
MVRWLNVLLARFSEVALGGVMVADAMIVATLFSLLAPMLFALLTQNLSSVALGLSFVPLVMWLGCFLVI